MLFVWPIDIAFATSCMPDPRGPVHPMNDATVVVVGTVGEPVFVASPLGRSYGRVPVAVEEVIRGDPTLREVTVIRGVGARPVGDPGTTVLLHLEPTHLEPGSHALAGHCQGFPAIEKRETFQCGAVAVVHTGVIAAYPADTHELPSMVDIAGLLVWVDAELVRRFPAEQLCRGLRWEDLLANVRAAAADGADRFRCYRDGDVATACSP